MEEMCFENYEEGERRYILEGIRTGRRSGKRGKLLNKKELAIKTQRAEK